MDSVIHFYHSQLASDLDFSHLATTPVISCDITLTASNGIAVPFHKCVLKQISTVFNDILEGDKAINNIDTPRLSASILKLLQIFFYLKPHDRDYDGIIRMLEKFDPQWRKEWFELEVIEAARKYNIEGIYIFVLHLFRSQTYKYKSFAILYREIEDLNIPFLKYALVDQQAERILDSDFPVCSDYDLSHLKMIFTRLLEDLPKTLDYFRYECEKPVEIMIRIATLFDDQELKQIVVRILEYVYRSSPKTRKRKLYMLGESISDIDSDSESY